MALADMLKRERERTDASGEPLELTINFKVCADCHAFFKAASTLTNGRPITVREPKMTHVFADGKCVCGDRWRWEARRE